MNSSSKRVFRFTALSALALACAALAQATGTKGLSGDWQVTATADNGTVLQQVVSVQQTTKNGVLGLHAGGYFARLNGNQASLSVTMRDSDAVRSYMGTVRFAGNTASGSVLMRETYPNGEVQLTRFRIEAKR